MKKGFKKVSHGAVTLKLDGDLVTIEHGEVVVFDLKKLNKQVADVDALLAKHFEPAIDEKELEKLSAEKEKEAKKEEKPVEDSKPVAKKASKKASKKSKKKGE